MNNKLFSHVITHLNSFLSKNKNSDENSKITVNYHQKDSNDILNPCLGVFPLNYPNI